MEIPPWLFFSSCALISIIFLHLGFYTLDKTDFSTSVSPVIMSIFKHSLAISSCCSSSYALIFSSRSTCGVNRRYFWAFFGIFPVLFNLFYSFVDGPYILVCGLMLWFLIKFIADVCNLPKLKSLPDTYCVIMIALFFSSEWFPWYFPILTLINFLLIYRDLFLDPTLKIRICIHMVVESSLCFVSGKNMLFFPYLVMFVSFAVSAFWATVSGFEPYLRWEGNPLSGVEWFRELLPVFEKVKEIVWTLKEKKMGKLLGFAIGLVGTIIFQHFFRLTSFNHVLGFLCVASSWMANLALLGVSSDFGVFNFLLGNVVVGFTVSQFGLGSSTWLAYGAALVLFGLRIKLESLTLLYNQINGPPL